MPAPTAASATARTALLAAARSELVERGHGAISLRAVARRAGLSHAAPKYHFTDRAGLLTVVAAEGFVALAAELQRVEEPRPQERLAALGRVYIDFGLAHPALFDLMFRPQELRVEDPSLRQAQQDAIGILAATVNRLPPVDPAAPAVPGLALISWALVHGLVALTRGGALQSAAGTPDPEATAELARHLAEQFSSRIKVE